MDIDLCLDKLRKSFEKEYDEYKPLLERLRKLLDIEIKSNPNNIKALCLIAKIDFELSKATQDVLGHLEAAYIKYKDSITIDEFSMLVTDMAYFYIEYSENKEGAAAGLLQEAVKRGSPYPETYFALALLYYNNDKYKQALPLFKKACSLSSDFKNRYAYALCLYKCGCGDESVDLLSEIILGWDKREDIADSYKYLGFIYAFQGNIDEAKRIAFDILEKDNSALKVEPADLAELMFLIGEYEKCAALYDSNQYVPNSRWLGKFYCLKAMGEEDKAKRKLDEYVKYLSSILADIIEEQEQNPENWTQDDKDAYISALKEDIQGIIKCFERVMDKNEKPAVYFKPYINGCYYLNCPRHSKKVCSS